jgi:hypothetical protein
MRRGQKMQYKRNKVLPNDVLAVSYKKNNKKAYQREDVDQTHTEYGQNLPLKK